MTDNDIIIRILGEITPIEQKIIKYLLPVYRRYSLVALISTAAAAGKSYYFNDELSRPEFEIWSDSYTGIAKILFKIPIERIRATKLLKAAYEIRVSRITTSTEQIIDTFLSYFQSNKLILGKED